MGCYPLGKMVSRALRKCNRKDKDRRRMRRADRMVVNSPPPTVTHSRSAAKTVTFSDNPVIVIPPEPTSSATVSKHHHETLIPPSPHACSAAAKGAESNEAKDHSQARSASGPDAHGGAPHGWSRQAPAYTGPGYRYAPSPLPAWDDGPRRGRYAPSPLPAWDDGPRREYFGGEYHYYPTPIREGIYSIATDANRLTAMFSEENPNACSIA